MRKVTAVICSAFAAKTSASLSNSWTDGTTLYLFGNKIATWENDRLLLNTCGYETATTKERLNGVLQCCNTGLRIYQQNFEFYIGDAISVPSGWFDPLLLVEGHGDPVQLELLSEAS